MRTSIHKIGGSAQSKFRENKEIQSALIKSKPFGLRQDMSTGKFDNASEDLHLGKQNKFGKGDSTQMVKTLSKRFVNEDLLKQDMNQPIGASDPVELSGQQVKMLPSDYFPMTNENYQIWFGASVSARSVKLIDEKTAERDIWWERLRKEIVKNAISVNCTHILGYRETIHVYDSIMIMSVFGTAIKVR